MNVICLQEDAFYALVDKVLEHAKKKPATMGDRWISAEEAMQKLRITSKTTLQKLRDEGKITFTHPEKKIILYDSFSIDDYLDKNIRKNF